MSIIAERIIPACLGKTRAEYCGCFAARFGVGNRCGNSTSILWLVLSLVVIASSAVLPLLRIYAYSTLLWLSKCRDVLRCFRSFLAAEAVTLHIVKICNTPNC